MAGLSFLRLVSGAIVEILGLQESAGAGDAGKIPALDATGRIHESMMPVGIGADTASVVSSEDLAAGDWVNIYASSGSKVRKADATTAGKEVDGFVLESVTAPAEATVYFEGTNTQISGMTPGSPVYLGTTPGIGTHSIPNTSGNIVQRIGRAVSATEVNFERSEPITLA